MKELKRRRERKRERDDIVIHKIKSSSEVEFGRTFYVIISNGS